MKFFFLCYYMWIWIILPEKQKRKTQQAKEVLCSGSYFDVSSDRSSKSKSCSCGFDRAGEHFVLLTGKRCCLKSHASDAATPGLIHRRFISLHAQNKPMIRSLNINPVLCSDYHAPDPPAPGAWLHAADCFNHWSGQTRSTGFWYLTAMCRGLFRLVSV